MSPPQKFTIAVLPGDGIGPEVIAEGIRVLRAVAAGFSSVAFNLEEYSVGANEYLARGNPLPDAVLEACRKADAILLGAMGLPHVRWPDGTEMVPQIDLREKLDLFCGLRPIRLYHELHTPLKNHRAGQIDFLIVRESTEGLFSGRGRKPAAGATEVCDTMRITRKGAERVCRAAFREAMSRRRHLTLVDKANVLPSMAFFRKIFDELAADFPEVETERIYVDAAALYLVQRPERFDVIVTENMFGDILSDLAAGLIGGMGMAPSADIGPEHAVFQPSHGTAPDIAGKGIANPTATILSVAMMLDWLAHPETRSAGKAIRHAVEVALANPANRTRDLGGKLSCAELGQAIIQQLP